MKNNYFFEKASGGGGGPDRKKTTKKLKIQSANINSGISSDTCSDNIVSGCYNCISRRTTAPPCGSRI